jgi:hypothetical protein
VVPPPATVRENTISPEKMKIPAMFLSFFPEFFLVRNMNEIGLERERQARNDKNARIF